jgi:hypothetical protein
MIAPKILPVRPSLESLRKQAKKLARETAAGKPAAIARVHAQLPGTELPLSRRDAQLILAREYGFAGWQDLREEVFKRTGKAQERVTEQAKRAVHDNNVERLRQLLAQYPDLISWSGGSLLGSASPYSDCFAPEREETVTRPACAELLIDAGAAVAPSVWNGLIDLGARRLLRLLWSRGLMPRTLRVLVALGDLDGVRECFDASSALRAGFGNADELAAVNDAFICACRFQHQAIASILLERCVTLDKDLGPRIDGGPGRDAFLGYLCARRLDITAVASGALGRHSSWSRPCVRSAMTISRGSRACWRASPGCSATRASAHKLCLRGAATHRAGAGEGEREVERDRRHPG